MGKRVTVGVGHHLRICSSARGEKRQHHLVTAGGAADLVAVQNLRSLSTSIGIRQPPIPLPVNENEVFQARADIANLFNLLYLVCAHDRDAGLRFVDPVLDILGCQQSGPRQRGYSRLYAADHNLIPGRHPRQNDDGRITALDPNLP